MNLVNANRLQEAPPRFVPGTPLPLTGMPVSIPAPSRIAKNLSYAALALFGLASIGVGLSTSLIYGDWMIALCSLPILLTAAGMVTLLGYFMFLHGWDLDDRPASDVAR